MAGRRPKPTRLKLLHGNPGRRRVDPTPEAPPGRPTRPQWLTGAARKEWDRICSILALERRLSAADGPALEKLATLHGRWTRWRELADTSPLTVTGPDGTPKPHPAIVQERILSDAYRKMLVEFGLTPASRGRVKIGGPAHGPGESPAEMMARFLRSRRPDDPA